MSVFEIFTNLYTIFHMYLNFNSITDRTSLKRIRRKICFIYIEVNLFNVECSTLISQIKEHYYSCSLTYITHLFETFHHPYIKHILLKISRYLALYAYTHTHTHTHAHLLNLATRRTLTNVSSDK